MQQQAMAAWRGGEKAGSGISNAGSASVAATARKAGAAQQANRRQ